MYLFKINMFGTIGKKI